MEPDYSSLKRQACHQNGNGFFEDYLAFTPEIERGGHNKWNTYGGIMAAATAVLGALHWDVDTSAQGLEEI